MAKKVPVSKLEAQWQAEEDARALQRAAEIARDPKRRKAAEAMIRKQIAELEKTKQSMEAILSSNAPNRGKKK